jgi:hypothetical protein
MITSLSGNFSKSAMECGGNAAESVNDELVDAVLSPCWKQEGFDSGASCCLLMAQLPGWTGFTCGVDCTLLPAGCTPATLSVTTAGKSPEGEAMSTVVKLFEMAARADRAGILVPRVGLVVVEETGLRCLHIASLSVSRRPGVAIRRGRREDDTGGQGVLTSDDLTGHERAEAKVEEVILEGFDFSP